MSKLYKTLFAGVETEYFSVTTIDKWASELISDLPNPAIWLMDLLNCENTECILDVIRGRLREIPLVFDKQYFELCLGFSYLRYKNNELSLSHFESSMLDVVDCNPTNRIDPERVYLLFHENKSLKKIENDLQRLLGQYAIMSKDYSDYVLSKRCLEQEVELLTEPV